MECNGPRQYGIWVPHSAPRTQSLNKPDLRPPFLHMGNDPIPDVLSIKNGLECITSSGVKINLLVPDTYCGKRLVTFAEQSRSCEGRSCPD